MDMAWCSDTSIIIIYKTEQSKSFASKYTNTDVQTMMVIKS